MKRCEYYSRFLSLKACCEFDDWPKCSSPLSLGKSANEIEKPLDIEVEENKNFKLMFAETYF
jgi:hypothetical protein